MLFLLLTPLLSSGQTNDAISREVSIFNAVVPPVVTNLEAISREVSIFNSVVPPVVTNLEAISREVSIFNSVVPPVVTNLEAISREVSIFNYGVPPVELVIGSTNALQDQPNVVPFMLQTVLDLTNVSLALQTDDSHLQILGVTPASPEVVSVALGAANSSGHPIVFTLNPAAIPATNHVLAWLNFQGITNLESAIVPLRLNNFSAARASGQVVPGLTADGQIILVVNRPFLFTSLMPQFGINMYGVPGATYSVESTTNLSPASWQEVKRVLQTNPFLAITGFTNTAPRQFFRTKLVGP